MLARDCGYVEVWKGESIVYFAVWNASLLESYFQRDNKVNCM